MSTHAGKRLPRPTPLTRPWWAACREGRLLLQRCDGCGHIQFYPRVLCTACGAVEPAWVEASGRGQVRSFTIIRHPVSPAYADEAPYALALVRLEEGPTMMGALRECDPEAVRIGQAVEVLFEDWSEEITMPQFRPARG